MLRHGVTLDVVTCEACVMRRSSVLSREITRYTRAPVLCMNRTIHMIASKRSRFTLKLPLFLHYWVSFEFTKYLAFTVLFSMQRNFSLISNIFYFNEN